MPIDFYLSKPPCRSVQLVAKRLKIDFKTLDMKNDEHLKPDFLKLNPANYIPNTVWVWDNGLALSESRAINQYLCNKYAPDSDLYPKDAKDRANVDRMLDFDMTLASSIGRTVSIRIYRPGVEPSEADVIALKNNLKLLDTLIGSNGYVASNKLTLADITIFATLVMLHLNDYDLSEYTNVKQWFDRITNELSYFDEIAKAEEEYKKVIEERESIAAKYNFTTHWFNAEQPQWQTTLITEFKGKKINVLEIGVFEGRSTIWILENLFDNPKSVLVALDTFKGSVEHTGSNTTWGIFEGGTVIEQIETTFLSNIQISGFQKQVQIMKGMSYDSLVKLNQDKRQFDFIYIDGSHNANDVLADAILAWPLLKENGIMIFDDYLWQVYKEASNNPQIAIDAFLACYDFEIELISKNAQVTIRKVNKERTFTFNYDTNI